MMFTWCRYIGPDHGSIVNWNFFWEFIMHQVLCLMYKYINMNLKKKFERSCWMPAMPASTYSHSSEIRDLRSTQFSRETLICHIFVIRNIVLHCKISNVNKNNYLIVLKIWPTRFLSTLKKCFGHGWLANGHSYMSLSCWFAILLPHWFSLSKKFLSADFCVYHSSNIWGFLFYS